MVRWVMLLVVVLVVIAVGVGAFKYRDALHRRFVEFPREAKAWEAIRAQRTEPAMDDGWTEFRGICHSHSELSHDSRVPFEAILAAAKEADIQFVFMSDHCDGNLADYSKGWKGIHDGVLFVRGYEMANGFMPWGLPEDTVLQKDADPRALSTQIEAAGGHLFFAHTEEERMWDLPELDGMEIYNIHTDVKDEGDDFYADLIPDVILSVRRYPEMVIRRVYDPQTAILANWDKLNRTRDITGIAANDCHQNQGIYGVYTENGSLLLHRTEKGHEPDEYNLNILTRSLLRLLPGPLEPGKEVFRLELDPYERQMRFVNTHLLATELSEPALLEALKEGRCFIAFDMIADARGFVFFAQDGTGRKAVMGETAPLKPDTRLRGESPYRARFRLLRDGEPLAEDTGQSFDFAVDGAGKYRIEAELDINGRWTPWVYTNPIRVAPEVPAASPAESVS